VIASALGWSVTSKAFRPPAAAGFISFVGPKETNQRKGPSSTKQTRGVRICRDFSTRHPCRVEKRCASLPAALRVSGLGMPLMCFQKQGSHELSFRAQREICCRSREISRCARNDSLVVLPDVVLFDHERIFIRRPEGRRAGMPAVFRPSHGWRVGKSRGHPPGEFALSGKAFFFGSFLLALSKRNEPARRRRAEAFAPVTNGRQSAQATSSPC